MPELPEVTTMINELRNKVLGKTIINVWTDAEKLIKKPANFESFKKEIIGKKIKNIERRGKVIIMKLGEERALLVHPKLTGHFLSGKWEKKEGKWIPIQKGPLEDPMNRFIHLILFLDNGQMIAFSDLRKFGRVELWKTNMLEQAEVLNKIGEDALKISLKQFEEVIKDSRKKKIKQVLMNQELIAGIGNIYSDEILFRAGVSPLRSADSLKKEEVEKIYKSIKEILRKAIKMSGSSVSDFRQVNGRRGEFDKVLRVYRREGQKCYKCGAIIKKTKIGGRSAHFCPICQK